MFGFLMPPKWHARQRECAKRRYENQLSDALPFENIKPPRSDDYIMVEAASYAPENPLTLVFGDIEATSHTREPNDDAPHSPTGRYAYAPIVLKAGNGLEVPYAPERDPAEVYFTDDVVIPRLVEARRGSEGSWRNWRVWMSLTPAEIWSQRSGISHARDTVVVGGLGMGWQLAQIMKRKQVKKVIVVEKSTELLDWYGYELCEKLGVHEVICGDVWDVFERFEPNDPKVRFVLDIWPGWWDARYDRQLTKKRREGFKIWAWGSPRGGSSW